MKLLREATRRIKSCVSPRALMLAMLALLVGLPTAAFAGEGDVRLNFAGSQAYLWASLGFGLIALIFAWWISIGVMKSSPGSEKMREVGLAIKEGALAYLQRQIMTMVWFVLAIA